MYLYYLCFLLFFYFFFFKQKTAYEMRISDWSSDVCSSDLLVDESDDRHRTQAAHLEQFQRLRLDALRGVDHHHRAVDCGEGAIGILAEILVPRREIGRASCRERVCQ